MASATSTATAGATRATCSGCNEPATVHCNDCTTDFCASCDDYTHGGRAPVKYRSHTRSAPCSGCGLSSAVRCDACDTTLCIDCDNYTHGAKSPPKFRGHTRTPVPGAAAPMTPAVPATPATSSPAAVAVATPVMATPVVAESKREEKKDIMILGGGEGGMTAMMAPIAGVPGLYHCTLDTKECMTDENKATMANGGLGQQLRLIPILDRSGSMGSTFANVLMPSCEMLYDELKPDSCECVFFGKTVETQPVKNSRFFRDNKNMTLEPATNIAGAYRTAIGRAMKHFAEEVCDFGRSVSTYSFVFMSDGADTVSKPAEVTAAINDYGARLRAAGLRATFLVVGIGTSSDTRIGMQAKLATETLTSTGTDGVATPVYYAREPRDLGTVIGQLVREQKSAVGGSAVTLEVKVCTPAKPATAATTTATTEPGAGQPLFNLAQGGFLARITEDPTATLSQRMESKNTKISFVFAGEPRDIARFVCNGIPVAAAISRDHADPTIVGSLIKQYAQDIRLSAVARKDITSGMSKLAHLVTALKAQSSVLSSDSFARRSPAERLRMMRSLKGASIEIDTMFNQLKAEVAIARETMSNEQAANWLNSAANMKYGAKALARAVEADSKELIADLKTLVTKITANRPSECAEDWSSFMSVMSGTEHLMQLEDVLRLDNASPTELLYALGMVGTMVRMSRSEAANINPWAINCDYVSCDRVDTASAMCALDSQHPLQDLSRHDISDVMVVMNPRNPEPYRMFMRTRLYETYLSVLFTRNPNLYMPAQQTALLMVALVRAITQLSDKNFATQRHVQNCFNIIYTLRERWGQKGLSDGYWADLISKLYLLSPGQFMTERAGDDIQSVVKILAALCCSDGATNLFYSRAPARLYTPPVAVDDEPAVVIAASGAPTAAAVATPAVAVSSPATPGEEKKTPVVMAKPVRVWHPSDYSQQLEEVGIALLAETTARSAKSLVKQKVAQLEKFKQQQAARTAAAAPPAPVAAAKKGKGAAAAPAKTAAAAPAKAGVNGGITQPGVATAPLVDESEARANLIASLLGIKKESIPTLLPDDSTDEDKEPSLAGCSDAFDWKVLSEQGEKFFTQVNQHSGTQCTLAGIRAVLTFARCLHTQVLPCITLATQEGKETFSALHTLLEHGECRGIKNGVEGTVSAEYCYGLIQRAFERTPPDTSTLQRCLFPDRDIDVPAMAPGGQTVPGVAPGGPIAATPNAFGMLDAALMLQAIRYQGSSERREPLPSLRDAERAIHDMALESRRRKYAEALGEKRARLRAVREEKERKEREEKEREAQRNFIVNHAGFAPIFTADEVKRLNANRPANDQLELMPGGMLRHHCTFPKCPQYLVNLATERDIREGGRRRGMYKHLAQAMWPTREYIQSLHKTAVTVFASTRSRGEDAFITTMTTRVASQPHGFAADELRSELRKLWLQLCTTTPK